MQTTLNNRLNDTTKVTLWTVSSYEAYNKPKSILYGNGSEINETSYDANNNRIIQKAYYDTNILANNPRNNGDRLRFPYYLQP